MHSPAVTKQGTVSLYPIVLVEKTALRRNLNPTLLVFSGVGIDWIIIKVNLTSVFDNDCTQDDYKRWSPADNSTGKHRNCILGKSMASHTHTHAHTR